MFLIVLAFIELIFYVLVFLYLPKKSHYEYDYLSEEFRKNSTFNYCGWYCEYFEENLKTTKNENQALLGFLIILLILVVVRIISCIVCKCKNYKENQ